jgi:N-acetylmuramoyl-L-alanine amidase
MQTTQIFRIFALLALLIGGGIQAATYTVKPSETFYSIAKRHGVDVDQLMKANKFSDARTLRAGQRLSIPSNKSSSSSKKSSTPTKKSLNIVLDAGHGGKDKGAFWKGVSESKLNLLVTNRVRASLKARGYKVAMTRTSDVFVSLSKRAEFGNRYRNSIFVSVHFNATSDTRVHGAETFYAGGKQGHYLASSIQSELVKKLKVTNRGARIAKFTVLTATRFPAVLVECGFISNSKERERCKTSYYQSTAAQAIVAGIERYDRSY